MKILFEVEPCDGPPHSWRRGLDDGLVGTMEFAPGLTVAAYFSAEDGALVVQIDTPEDGPQSDQHERIRVHLNDATAERWRTS